MTIFVYGDDSSDAEGQRVCAVAGVVGSFRAWRQLEREWLIRTNRIPFHATDCDSNFGDYRDTSNAENKALYKDLAIMVANSHVHGVAVSIDLIAQKRVFPGSEEVAYYRAFTQVIAEMKQCAEENGEVAEMTFDMKLDTLHNAGLLYGFARENQPDWTPHVADKIIFEFSRKQPRLQVADLFAHEAMKALDNMVGPVKRQIRKSRKALEDSGRFHIEAHSDEWFEGLKRSYAELEKKVGFNKQDYMDWLAKKRRQHSITSFILFCDWIDKRNPNAE